MSAFERGYDSFMRLNGAKIAADAGTQYVGRVEAAIEKLSKAINSPDRKIDNQSIDTLKGFIAEWWHEGTFNIDAALKNVKINASAPDDNGIVDIVLSNGDKYQVKYYKSGNKSAAQQAKTNYERYQEYRADYKAKGEEPPLSQEEYIKEKFPHDPYYLGQGRLIPADQMKDAQKWLEKQISKELKGGRSEQAKRYQDTLDMLTDRIKSGNGAESIPLTEEEAKTLARLAKEKGFDPAKWGLSTESLIGMEYIMREAFRAGLSAALVSVVLKVAPEICGIICKLINSGEIDAEDFKQLGFSAIAGGAEGFVRGAVAAAVTTACKAGVLGVTLKTIDPSIVGAITAVALNTIKNSVLLSFGKITKQEFADRCAQDLVVTGCAIGGGVVGVAITTAFFTPAAVVFGYIIGSFVGSVIGVFVYKGIYSCVLSYCVESGSTFFGLVEQNYELPREALEEIGLDVFEYEKYDFEEFGREGFEYEKFRYEEFDYETIGITILRRGVIGVRQIGYV